MMSYRAPGANSLPFNSGIDHESLMSEPIGLVPVSVISPLLANSLASNAARSAMKL
jgi:hypothetical protein